MIDLDEKMAAAIELMIAGIPKVQIAVRIGVHRNTITNWSRDPAFQQTLNARLNERAIEARLSRDRRLTAYTDRLVRLLDAAFRAVERQPHERQAHVTLTRLLREYRALVATERVHVLR